MKAKFLGCFLLLATLPAMANSGLWQNIKGPSGTAIMVRVEGKKDGKFLLRRQADMKLFEVLPDLLDPAEASKLDAQAKELAQEIDKLNQAAGHKMFFGTAFENLKGSDIASALELSEESKTAYSRSWRNYTGSKYRLFGARPYSVALYASGEDQPTNLSIVYANKGDYSNNSSEGEGHFDGQTTATRLSLMEAMDQDRIAVTKALTDVLGPGQAQRYGEGKARRQVLRWDWNGQSFILSAVDGEYVSLSIVPMELAEMKGKTGKVDDMTLKDRLKNAVVHKDNGDTYLSQIPMVNQGPKGYCVPATFERAMRTMGMDADMYLLAMVGQTSMGGGTSVENLLSRVKSEVYNKGRRTKDEAVKKVTVRDVKRYIDQGVPIMWTMLSLDQYNEIANKDTEERAKVTDWAAWKTQVQQRAQEVTKQKADQENHHICMIIGYNEATDEIAVSDSWGKSYELRWVPATVATWCSQGAFFMILP
jgi:Peptidase_C39 like family